MAVARTRDAITPVRYDAYFGLLVLSTIGLLIGLTFAYLDYSGYNPAPKALNKTVPGAGFSDSAPGNTPNTPPTGNPGTPPKK